MYNKAVIMGRIGTKEPKTTKNNAPITLLSVATNKIYKDSTGAKQDMTTWHNVNCFGKLADIVKNYAHVGDLILIEGEIQNRKVTNELGENRYFSSITATQIKLMPNKNKEHKEVDGNRAFSDEGVSIGEEFDDDIPF